MYFDIGQFKAAAVAFGALMNAYPDSDLSDQYKLMQIKSYFRYAEMSVEEKKQESFEKVIEECNDFSDRFPQSPLAKEVDQYLNLSKNNLKNYTNEPSKTTT